MFKSLIAIGICSVFLGFTFQEGSSVKQEGSAKKAAQPEAGMSATKTDDGMKKEKLAGIKCVVSGKAVQQDKLVKYKDGEVYLCCNECVAEFVADTAKYKTKANHQLVASGQYVQKACPISGEPVAEGVTAKVAAIKIGLCCKDCIKKLGNVETPAVELVFGNDVFTKAFIKKGAKKKKNPLAGIKCPMMPGKNVKATSSVDYKGSKVYFCCDSCAAEFENAPEKYSSKANQQLVQTGQYVQRACPFSGETYFPEHSVKVGGAQVYFCCESCKETVKNVKDDNARTDLIFGDKRFEKGFKKKTFTR